MKKEYPLPLLVDTLMHEKGLRVEVLSTEAPSGKDVAREMYRVLEEQ